MSPPPATPTGRGRRALVVAPQPFFTERGTPIAVRYVLRALSELGWTVDLLTLPIGHDVDIERVTVHRAANPLRVRRVPVGFSPSKAGFDVLLAASMTRRLRTETYDVVHAVEEAAMIAAAIVRNPGPALVYDMASSIPEQLAQSALSRLPGARAVARALERRTIRRADAVVYSAGLREFVEPQEACKPLVPWRFPAEPPCSSQDAVRRARARAGVPEDARTILYAGNFASYQGTDLLRAAAEQVLAELDDVHVVLVGAADAQERASLQQAWRSCGDRVHVVERVPQEDMAGFMSLATLFVSPRIYGVNFPLKLFDYLAAGKAIVATDIPAHRCLLDDSLVHFVEPTPPALAAGILTVLKDAERADALSAAARHYAARELSWERFVSLIRELYDGAMRCRDTVRMPVGT